MSANKSFNIPAAGCGWAIVEDAALRKAFSTEVAAHVIGSPSVFGLAATLAALRHGDDWLAAQLDYLRGNRDLVESTIGLPMAHVEATYLAWIDCSSIKDAAELFLKNGVAVYPGEQFGDSRYVRLNFGTQRARLEEALRRIKSASTPSPKG
jgi:bifunctional pyridoxal-dependent enzyme with beta-cystathionase and maltose regulon repressor activities